MDGLLMPRSRVDRPIVVHERQSVLAMVPSSPRYIARAQIRNERPVLACHRPGEVLAGLCERTRDEELFGYTAVSSYYVYVRTILAPFERDSIDFFFACWAKMFCHECFEAYLAKFSTPTIDLSDVVTTASTTIIRIQILICIYHRPVC